MVIWPEFTRKCKSRISAIARNIYHSRSNWKERAKQLQQTIRELEQENQCIQKKNEVLQRAAAEANEKVEQLQEKINRTSEQTSVRLPDDPPLPYHQYGPRLISLCVNLARKIGLRPCLRALKIVFQWLGVKVCLPTWQAIRVWLQRLGLARTKRVKKRGGKIWIVDHSVQLGKEKVLVILAVDPAKLPKKEQALRQSDVDVLLVQLGESWKREDVAQAYQKTAATYGTPRAILADGAVELRESIDLAEWPGKSRPIFIRDFKHFLANRLEAKMNKDTDFAEFLVQLNQTRSAIQQTELSHLTPPAIKSKARFMNLEAVLRWGLRTLWYVQTPSCQKADQVTQDRVQTKLGWLKEYALKLKKWGAYQDTISASLTWINQHGLRRGSSKKLRRVLQALPGAKHSQWLIDEAVAFVKLQEKELQPKERLWLSSEIIESAFGQYKQFEGQYSRGSFTSLLPTFACLLKNTTTREVTEAFETVRVKELNDWLKENFPNTNQSKRRRVNKLYQNATKKKNNKSRATPATTTI